MDNSILVVYKSSTGFTKKYAKMIASELNCKILRYDKISLDIINEYDTVIFGSRIVGGHIDDITRMLKLIEASHINHFIIFITGASDYEDENVKKVWDSSLTKAQREKYPHYYFPGGLNFKDMGLVDKGMLKSLMLFLKFKRNKTKNDIALEKKLSKSFDISDKKYINPLIESLK